jgi:hypothetical protein
VYIKNKYKFLIFFFKKEPLTKYKTCDIFFSIFPKNIIGISNLDASNIKFIESEQLKRTIKCGFV